MNLIELFNSLDIPSPESNNIYNANVIREYPSFHLGVNTNGNPVLLFPAINEKFKNSLKNYRLKYLKFELNVECKITENGNSLLKRFSTLTFNSSDIHLVEYFLRISESLVKTLFEKLPVLEGVEVVKKFIDIFSFLNEPPSNTIQGLWGELFLILNSRRPDVLINYWHASPMEKFDFHSGREILEVKSSQSFDRIHNFSSEQLSPPSEMELIVASLFVRRTTTGKSIQDLAIEILAKIHGNEARVEKLNNIIFKTLGNTFEQATTFKFDHDIAKQSLRFYRLFDIKRIEELNIPSEVTNVHYNTNLNNVKFTILSELLTLGDLFHGL
jgi:hypothetical protein